MIPSGARGAWKEIESRLRPYVARRVARGADVDDVLQEIFVRVHRGLASLHDSERFGPWVYRIAEHVVVDSARSRARDPLARVAEMRKGPKAFAGADEGADLQADLGECVALFVARLPSLYREAILLAELEGLTHEEGADMLGISLAAMKARVRRGREKIRTMFGECCRISVDRRGRVVGCEARALEEIPKDCRAAATSWTARHG